MNNLTAKQEKFAQEWYATGNKTEAYRRAYNSENMAEDTINNKAYQLSTRDDIRARYEELQKAGQKRSEVTVDTLNDMFMTAFKMAQTNGNAGAVIQAANGLSKLHGLDKLSATQIKKLEIEIEASNNDEKEVQPLNIIFDVSPAVSDVKITKGK